MPRTHYEILGVPSTATQAEIKAAFRKKALQHHPDRGGDPVFFDLVNEAHRALEDENARRAYDRRLAGDRAGTAAPGGADDWRDAPVEFAEQMGKARAVVEEKAAAVVQVLDLLGSLFS